MKIRNRCFFIIFSVVGFISEQLYNTFTDKGFFDDIVLAKRLSYYYLDRNPSYNEILLYHRMSILINEPNILTIPINLYEIYLEHFEYKDLKVETLRDERYVLLGESKAAFLNYKSNVEGDMIKYFQTSKVKNIMPLRTSYSSKLKIKKGVCEKISTIFDELNLTNSQGINASYLKNACLKIGGGIVDNGGSVSLSNYLNYLLDEYVDFVYANKDNRDIAKFLKSKLYLSIIYQMLFVYNISWKITSVLISQDLSNMFSRIYNVEFTFKVIESITFICLVLLLYIVLIFHQKRSLVKFGKIIGKMNYIMKG